jgi:glycosyltransferase involved in cell wall biosynthesis
MNPFVSICIFTYNHEKFIAQCIESVLMQKTNFNFEIILGEDYSTDNTRSICTEYTKKYPEKVRLLDRGKNLGMCENVFDTLRNANGDYLAILDGDDYWIHPFKLQMQFDFLELHWDKNLVFHQTIIIDELSGEVNLFVKEEKSTFCLNEIIGSWIMATGAMFFRKSAMDYPEFLSHTHNFDLAIQLIVNREGSKTGYLNEIMSVYRINFGSNTKKPEYDFLNTWERQKLLFEEFNIYTNCSHSDRITEKIVELDYYIKQNGRFNIKNEIKLYLRNLMNWLGYRVTITKL